MPSVINSVTGALGQRKRVRAQATFTRATNTTTYTANDVVGPVTTPAMQTLAGCAAFNGGSGKIVDVILAVDEPTVTAGTFRVLFYNAIHTPAADNAAFDSFYANADEYQGSCDLPTLVLNGEGAVSRNSGRVQTAETTLPIPFVCASGDTGLYAVIVATGAYVPKSGGLVRLSVVVEQD